ncbi:unnamed protein product [Notodromas monacha]|uniref:CDAN1-interacting nuclease 1 n=1 Tax=Notodromas monacha TaxID=399045 RepID=A0A7R9GCW0_9CRUS|nr:unnamed protein product [Notodromas monacha]CAG0916277.1 unnamed protein product [Notodromas monacha]
MAVISKAQYDEIIECILSIDPEIAIDRNKYSVLLDKFPSIRKRTLGSILSAYVQRQVRRNHHRVLNKANGQTLYKQFLESVSKKDPPGIILKMADKLQFSPALLARFLVEQNLKESSKNSKGKCTQQLLKNVVKARSRDPELIPDRDLKYEVWLANLEDPVYGPQSDLIGNQIGFDYEEILKQNLEKLGLSFYDETDLRAEDFDKTPDVKLVIPIAIDGFIVNWIESKAMFGDPQLYEEHYQEQFSSYVNRFGGGLVIYWFGYVSELDKDTHRGVKISSELPGNFVKFDPAATLKRHNFKFGGGLEKTKEQCVMNFAKKVMRGMGWEEGEGLGKSKQGMKEALKPVVKLNTNGLGHDAAKEFTFNWWEHVYDTAAKNVDVEETHDGVKVKKHNRKLLISTTTGGQLVEEDNSAPEKKRKKKKKNDGDDGVEYASFVKGGTAVPVAPVALRTTTDDELFKICGGLTAHKSERHGHRLNGKLKRLEAHEARLADLSFTENFFEEQNYDKMVLTFPVAESWLKEHALRAVDGKHSVEFQKGTSTNAGDMKTTPPEMITALLEDLQKKPSLQMNFNEWNVLFSCILTSLKDNSSLLCELQAMKTNRLVPDVSQDFDHLLRTIQYLLDIGSDFDVIHSGGVHAIIHAGGSVHSSVDALITALVESVNNPSIWHVVCLVVEAQFEHFWKVASSKLMKLQANRDYPSDKWVESAADKKYFEMAAQRGADVVKNESICLLCDRSSTIECPRTLGGLGIVAPFKSSKDCVLLTKEICAPHSASVFGSVEIAHNICFGHTYLDHRGVPEPKMTSSRLGHCGTGVVGGVQGVLQFLDPPGQDAEISRWKAEPDLAQFVKELKKVTGIDEALNVARKNVKNWSLCGDEARQKLVRTYISEVLNDRENLIPYFPDMEELCENAWRNVSAETCCIQNDGDLLRVQRLKAGRVATILSCHENWLKVFLHVVLPLLRVGNAVVFGVSTDAKVFFAKLAKKIHGSEDDPVFRTVELGTDKGPTLSHLAAQAAKSNGSEVIISLAASPACNVAKYVASDNVKDVFVWLSIPGCDSDTKMSYRPRRTDHNHVIDGEENWFPGKRRPGTGKAPVPSGHATSTQFPRPQHRFGTSANYSSGRSRRQSSVGRSYSRSSRSANRSETANNSTRRRVSTTSTHRRDAPRKDFLKPRHYPPQILRIPRSEASNHAKDVDPEQHPLLVGDFTTTSLVLSQYDDRRHRTVGGAPSHEIPRRGSNDSNEDVNPDPPADPTRVSHRDSLSSRGSTDGLMMRNRTRITSLLNEPRENVLNEGILRQRSAQDEEDERASNVSPNPAGSVVGSDPGSVEVGRSPNVDGRASGASQLSGQRATGDDGEKEDEEEEGGWKAMGEDDPDTPRGTKHDYLDDGPQQPGDEGVPLKQSSARASTARDDNEPPPGEAEALDNEIPPDEEGGSSKRPTEPQPEPFNRDVFLMSILLVLATSYSWNVIQSCSTELKFAMPNIYGKRGWMAPWYLASLLRGAVSLVKLGELYDDGDQVDQLDKWTAVFMKTLGIALLTGELQCEVLMTGLPTSPAFWFFLGAIPFVMQLNADHDPDSPFARIPEIYLGCLIFLQLLMGISAKRWLMLFNPLILGLTFFDHGYSFSSDVYLYMILMNLFYAIAIDKRLHGGTCPPPGPPNNCNRCG